MFEEPKQKEEKETSIFDDEEYDEVDLEDIQLAEIGVIPGRMDLFRKRYPHKKVFHNNALTKQAFEYYLEIVDDKELKAINKDKLPEKLQELYIAKLGKGVVEVIEEDDSVISQYVQKNKELIQELDKCKNANIYHQEYADKTKIYLIFLYKMNGKMLRNLKDNDIPFPFSDKELDTIKQIKEMIE